MPDTDSPPGLVTSRVPADAFASPFDGHTSYGFPEAGCSAALRKYSCSGSGPRRILLMPASEREAGKARDRHRRQQSLRRSMSLPQATKEKAQCSAPMSAQRSPSEACGDFSSASHRNDAELTELLEEKTESQAGGNSATGMEFQTDPATQNEEEEEEEVRVLTLPLQAHHAMEKMEEFVYKVWEGRWRVIPYDVLPDWLKDNDYLLYGHRPPMPSFRACFKSIFRIHTETGNIWTHLLGFVFFLCLGILTLLRPNMYFMAPLQEKVVFGMFFLGAVLCLSFSWLFHTVYCHSEKVSRTFSKLDYSGIALLIMGSFVPWLYYSFYCSPQPRLIYLGIVCALGISAIIVAQWDRFATPKHRLTRAGVFLGLGLSGIVPTLHFTIAEGFVKATTVGQMGWFYLMAVMYITGAGLYAARIPERFFPGKCDIWFQSHQLFHVLVVVAAFVHFHGVSNLQEFRYGLEGGCTDDSLL